MTHEEQIAKLTEMLEIQQKLHETAIDMLKPAIEIAVQKEREACALICDAVTQDMSLGPLEKYRASWLANAIRTREKT